MNRIVIELRKKIKILLLLLFPAVTLYILYIKINPGLPEFLSETRKVEANILVIEGWLPDKGIRMAINEIQNGSYDFIVTTGVRSSDLDYCLIGMNGYLIFYPRWPKTSDIESNSHTIEITAKSLMGGIYSTHINFFVNDSVVADFIVDNEKLKYRINWNKSLAAIDSFMIHFDNDMVDEKGDRNLFVKEINIDNKITIPYQFNSVFDVGQLDNKERILNNHKSIAEFARNKLSRYGIDSSRLIALPGSRTRINRTLASALAFRNWLKDSEIKVSGINVVTMGIHARRTWLTYRKVLNKSYNVGVVSLADPEESDSKNPDKLRIFTETLDLIYYNLILIPYQIFK